MIGLKMLGIYRVPTEDIEKVIWNGDYKEYDNNLFHLGSGHDKFIIINPAFINLKILDNIEPITVDENRCVVWKYKDQWIAKYFNKHWIVEKRYLEIEIDLKLDIEWQKNPELDSNIIFDYDPTVNPISDLYDLNYEMIWYVNPKYTDSKIWAYRGKLKDSVILGNKDMGYVSLPGPDQLDVIFISYNEPNAEKNWRRVLEKSPKAYRVNGVKGIVNAHKCAAELATTDMFYVVDGDAYLTDNWDFTYQPSIFDRDCVHVWHSRNPINGLEYGYGGVKLLPRQLTLNVETNCIDMTTNISSKFKSMNTVSNVTEFNTNEFNTFRSAFRECAKLASDELSEDSKKRLDIWCNTKNNALFAEWSIVGANAGKDFGHANKNYKENLVLINDFNWIQSEFSKILLLNNILSGEI